VQDAVPVGEVSPLSAALTREDGRFVVSLANPNADYVEGQVSLVTPLESWGAAADTLALASITPRVRQFQIAARGEEQVAFGIDGPGEGVWAVAKVAWYGRVQYVQLGAAR
jgi:hypothetical protein